MTQALPKFSQENQPHNTNNASADNTPIKASAPLASRAQKLSAEIIGTAFLLAIVIGSGIMGDSLAGGNTAIALLGNTIATGAGLAVLILIFGPVSGAHFNPAVSLCFLLRGELSKTDATFFVLAQIIGGVLGVWAAHLMFAEPLFQISTTARSGLAQMFAEGVATFGLIFTILGCLRSRPDAIPYAVGLYITAGYWFTASTSFANPAVTIARMLSDTFAGIMPSSAPGFIAAQLIAAVIATFAAGAIFPSLRTKNSSSN